MGFHHFLSTQNLNQAQILALLEKAQTFISSEGTLKQPPALLHHKTVANLFFENSTRTRCSFELAAKRLGAYVLNFDASTSSTQKGETVLDTVLNLQAMGVDLFVIRHSESGLPAWIAEQLNHRASVINAGDGSNEHPTQAMLDIFTIQQFKPNFSTLRVAFVGDIFHSRVAHSLASALLTMKVPDIRFVAPPKLLPAETFSPNISLHTDLISGIRDADVVITLRLQKERMEAAAIPNTSDYFLRYGLTQEKLKFAKPDAIVMHPGPMNREVEIESLVADGPQSVILEQPKYGVAMRMAIMEFCVGVT